MGRFERKTKLPAMEAASSLDKLLAYDGQQLIRCAYLTILGREPDPQGRVYYQQRLRNGIDKIQIVAQLYLSKEGRKKNRDIPGLKAAVKRYKRSRYPFVGWLFRRRVSRLERKLMGIENQIYMLGEEIMQMDFASNGLLKATALQAPADGQGKLDEIAQLPMEARKFYYQLKSAAVARAERLAECA
jgi:hypothetical protein